MALTLPTLPNEIYLEILLQCDYFTIKTCRRVCKTFAALVSHASMDKLLFRSTVDSSDGKMVGGCFCKDFIVHPALLCFNLGANHTVRLVSPRDPPPLAVEVMQPFPRVPSSPTYRVPEDVASEYATYPSTSEVRLYNKSRDTTLRICIADGTRNVTVWDILGSIEAGDWEMVVEPGHSVTFGASFLQDGILADCSSVPQGLILFYDTHHKYEGHEGGDSDSGSETEESAASDNEDDKGKPKHL